MMSLTHSAEPDARIYDVGIRGRVAFIYVNQHFELLAMPEQIMQELGRLKSLRFSQGRFALEEQSANLRLQRLLRDVLSVDAQDLLKVGGYLKAPAPGSDTILLSVFPFGLHDTPEPFELKHYAEIRISYPKPGNLLMFNRAMRDLYQLSASESRVVSLLVQGRNTKEIASTLAVADSTLRTHLKRIFSKTETRHQAELVSKILQYDSYVMPDRLTV